MDEILRRIIYLRIYSLAEWFPRANLNNDDNKWACEMSFFENYVPQYPPFCVMVRDVMKMLWKLIWSDPDSAGFRDSHYSQIKCRWLDAASSSIFSLFPHLNLHFNSSYFKYLFFCINTKTFPPCSSKKIFSTLIHTVTIYTHTHSHCVYLCVCMYDKYSSSTLKSLCFNFQHLHTHNTCIYRNS